MLRRSFITSWVLTSSEFARRRLRKAPLYSGRLACVIARSGMTLLEGRSMNPRQANPSRQNRVLSARRALRRVGGSLILAAAVQPILCVQRALAVTRTFVGLGGGNWSVGR